MSDPVTHWQILSPQPEQTHDFLHRLFGWEFSGDNRLGYRMSGAPSPIDGGIWPLPPGVPAFVQLYVAVDDIPAKLHQTLELGGTVLMPHQILPDGDEMAVIRTPDGLSLGLAKRR